MRLHIPALIAALSIAAGSAVASAQSLATLSKKEEERRKTVKAPSKVYTNKDLGSAPATPAPAASADAAKPAVSADAQKDAPPEAKPEQSGPAKDQAYWSGRMKELQANLDRDQTYLDALQSRINSLSTDFVNRDDPAQRAKISSDRQRAVAEHDRLRQQIEAGKKAIADLEEEARRAGVPPGWLR
jgi:hypothetical protein